MFIALGASAFAACNDTLQHIVIGSGHDLGQTKEATSDDCCEKCTGTADCLSWTWHTDTHACWVHSSAEGRKSEHGAVSGVRNGPIPAASAWYACNTSSASTFKFCDTSLTIDERVDDLVARVTIEEAGPQLTARESPAIDRLGVPSYYWGTNAIHGIQNVQCLSSGACPTSFPAPVGLSASFNMSLVYEMGGTIGRELRAYWNGHLHNR